MCRMQKGFVLFTRYLHKIKCIFIIHYNVFYEKKCHMKKKYYICIGKY